MGWPEGSWIGQETLKVFELWSSLGWSEMPSSPPPFLRLENVPPSRGPWAEETSQPHFSLSPQKEFCVFSITWFPVGLGIVGLQFPPGKGVCFGERS